MTLGKNYEDAVKACYSTWSTTYYDEYYGNEASYPPIHRELLKRLLKEAQVKTLLDAGCGPASFLRELEMDDIDVYGFDLTPEMVAEAKQIMTSKGVNPDHFWEGSVTDPRAYLGLGGNDDMGWDAAICIGVLPHIPAEEEEGVIRNLYQAIRPGGTVIVEARNQLFSLFTMNRYSYEFIVNQLIKPELSRGEVNASNLDDILDELKQYFRMDLPPVRKGKKEEPGYDEVLSRTHNPLLMKERFLSTGYKNVQVLFYHYHVLPPMFASRMPDFFRQQSMQMEDPEDWRGYFMASAFLTVGQRP